MKPLLFSILLSLSFAHLGFAQFFEFGRQYFDGEDTLEGISIRVELDTSAQNIWQIGPPQKTIFSDAATVPNTIVTDTLNPYPTNNISRFIAHVPTLTNFGVFALQWKQKLDMDSDFDGGIIEYSVDSGSTWVNVFNNPYVSNFYGFNQENADTLQGGEFAFSGTDAEWKDVWLCFEFSWLSQFESNNVPIRFTFISDGVNTNKEGWMIDNMVAHPTFIHVLKEVPLENYLTVYPNPANNIVHVQAAEMAVFHIIEKMELIDPLGRVVESWTNIPTKFWFDTNKYSNGMYFLKVRTNIKSETVPLVIHKR